MNKREAILEGTQVADRLHVAMASQRRLQEGKFSRIDVFAAAVKQGAMLLFRPLKGIQGAYLGRPEFPVAGIVVSTQRDLHVQRFTAAHELGHFMLGHTMPSLDESVGLWRSEQRDVLEIAADAFASEFLLPRWLFVHHARLHRWDTAALARPEVAYQLSLRLGASYEATIWGLAGHKILSQSAAERLRSVTPKQIKASALAGRAPLHNSWADVWLIDESDHGQSFEGGPDDVVIFRVRERGSSGYLWDEAGIAKGGFEILADERVSEDEQSCGEVVTRILVTKVSAAGEYQVATTERRPWVANDSLQELSVGFDLHGKEQGLPRYSRRILAVA